ncbi:MAG: phenylalanine--tRNA ligase subunit beta, partial [Angustibacter sp.]
EEGLHGAEITGPLVVGEVLSKEPEPQKNGKVIHWCQVRVGPEQINGVVCGASNFAPGDFVAVALPGAVLPGGFGISARKTYGHLSAGMMCSEKELGLGEGHEGILVLNDLDIAPELLVPGADAVALLGADELTVEINVTPDRGYCFSSRGIAREYSLSTRREFLDPVGNELEIPAPTPDGFEVLLRDEAPVREQPGCSRYVARVLTGFGAGAPSPDWLRRVLVNSAMRPISLAVDVTNYVMLLTGQPLHAFDLAALGERIVVRRARSGEHLTTLDGVQRTLDSEDLVISDERGGESRVLALAGVMGGASSEVGATTTALLLEAAHFDPVSIARTSRRHRLSTEASRRYERGVDPQLAPRAAEVAAQLLISLGGAVPGPVTMAGEP